MNNLRSVVLVCLFLISGGACKQSHTPTELSAPIIFALTVSDLEESMNWYQEHLFFIPDTVMNFPNYGITVGMMHQAGFFMEFVQFEKDLSPSGLAFPEGSSALNGFFKIGFQAADILGMYDKLSKTRGVNIAAPLDDLLPVKGVAWPDQYFLLNDPDGNYVQIFSLKPGQSVPGTQLIPFLMASSSSDLNRSIDWYREHLNAQLIDRVGQTGNERAILEKDDLIIELGAFEGYAPFEQLAVPDGIGLSQVHGIRKLSILVPDINEVYVQMKRRGIPFTFDLTEQKFMAGDRYFMINDDTGNAIQFIARDE